MQFEKLVAEKILSNQNANNENNDTFWREYQKKKQIKNQMIEKILIDLQAVLVSIKIYYNI